MSKRKKRLKKQRKRERKNDQMKIGKKPKNKKERKKLKRKRKEEERHWKNARHRNRNPAGYKKYQDRKNKSSKTKSSPSKQKGKSSDKISKYKISRGERRDHKKNIRDTEKATKDLKNYKPRSLNVKRNEYKSDLPPRPSVPKLPTITTPGGDLKVTKVASPSGLKGKTINQYQSKPDYSNVYTNLKPKKIKNPNAPTK